jgi:hypothetical protein
VGIVVKRKLGKLGVLIVVLGLLVACPALSGCRPKAPPLVLTPPWQAGEFSRLDWSDSTTGGRLGSWDTEVKRDPAGGGYVLSMWTNLPGASEHSDVTVSAADLAPSLLEYQGEVGEAKTMYVLRAEYAGGKVTITATKDGVGQPVPTVKLPKGLYFDNEQFTFVLRALPLAEGFQATLNVIVTKNATKMQISVVVGAAESVTVPAGTFDCWPVELVGLGQKAWIAVDDPHQLVQYSSGSGAIISKLTEFRPGP